MMASEDVQESQRIVRMYSWDAEARLPPGNDAHVLGHVLGENTRREDLQSRQAALRQTFDSVNQTAEIE